MLPLLDDKRLYNFRVASVNSEDVDECNLIARPR
jgi:hypothetical protein